MKRLGPDPLIHETAHVAHSTFGHYCEVMEGCQLNEVDMGDYSYCARYADIWCSTIGKFSNIAGMTRINPGNHPTDRASMHHFMYRSAQYWEEETDDQSFFDWRRAHRVEIGHDTWIGHGAIVLPGRRVGTGSVIGAGAVVTKDVPEFEIWAGNPAKLIRRRFSVEIAARLTRLAWWNWDHARLGAALEDFRTLGVEAFLDRHEP
jgi:phosphonate metabolism protein (transferase hexapeptide repeat family)